MAVDPPGMRPRRAQWADLMRAAFGYELLLCPRCGGKMRSLACIGENTQFRASSDTGQPFPLSLRCPRSGSASDFQASAGTLRRYSAKWRAVGTSFRRHGDPSEGSIPGVRSAAVERMLDVLAKHVSAAVSRLDAIGLESKRTQQLARVMHARLSALSS